MKIEKFIASSMPEAMKEIRSKLGSDAVILNSKVIYTGGFLGFFKKRQIEVVAAVDPSLKAASLQERSFLEKNSLVDEARESIIPFKDSKLDESASNVFKEDEKLTKQTEITINEQSVLDEIKNLQNLITKMETVGKNDKKVYPEDIQKIVKLLDRQAVDQEIQTIILDKLLERWFAASPKPSYEDLVDWSKQILHKKLSLMEYGEINYDKKYINVIGPTGVGKTTTLAKMAATAVLKDKKRAAFITTDTYRIAAIDQLKTYAKILCIPLEVCYNAEDFNKALEKFANFEVVFIDTAGRNFKKEQYVTDLKDMLQFNDEMQTFLVLSLTAKQSDMEMIFDKFSKIKIDKLIFTKADETGNYGAIVNMIIKNNIGLAYLTNGQDVPDDIVVANPNLIINTIFEEQTYE